MGTVNWDWIDNLPKRIFYREHSYKFLRLEGYWTTWNKFPVERNQVVGGLKQRLPLLGWTSLWYTAGLPGCVWDGEAGEEKTLFPVTALLGNLISYHMSDRFVYGYRVPVAARQVHSNSLPHLISRPSGDGGGVGLRRGLHFQDLHRWLVDSCCLASRNSQTHYFKWLLQPREVRTGTPFLPMWSRYSLHNCRLQLVQGKWPQ